MEKVRGVLDIPDILMEKVLSAYAGEFKTDLTQGNPGFWSEGNCDACERNCELVPIYEITTISLMKAKTCKLGDYREGPKKTDRPTLRCYASPKEIDENVRFSDFIGKRSCFNCGSYC